MDPRWARESHWSRKIWMDHFPLQNWRFGDGSPSVCSCCSARSDVASPPFAMSTSPWCRRLRPRPPGGRTASDPRDDLSNFHARIPLSSRDTCSRRPRAHSQSSPLNLETIRMRSGYWSRRAVGAGSGYIRPFEPPSGHGPVRRLPKTDPLTDDTIDRLPSVEPGILPATKR